MSHRNEPKPSTASPVGLEGRTDILADVAAYATEYLKTVEDRAVAPTPKAIKDLSRFREPLPEASTPAEQVLAMLHNFGSPATVAKNNGRFFGFVNGGLLPAALGAAWMVSAWDQNAAFFVQSPVAITLEEIALGWVRELLGLPEGTGGAVVTGATMANFSSLASARHAILARQGWNVEADGLFGAPPINVVVSEEAHASVHKALSLLGMGRDRVFRVRTDSQGRMRAADVPHLDANSILVLQAGNVNTGAFDPAAAIIPTAHEAGAWVHVDGAFGLWANTSPQYQHLVKGFQLADSWATDAHKWPNIGYDCGLALVRDPEQLREAMSMTASYLALGDHREPSDYNPELSRRARGVELWAGLRAMGRAKMGEIIERTSAHARRFAEGLKAAGHEILNDVVINQVLVSFGSRERTLAVVAKIQKSSVCWAGSTVWQGKTAMRISVSNWSTTAEDVERSLAAMIEAARA